MLGNRRCFNAIYTITLFELVIQTTWISEMKTFKSCETKCLVTTTFNIYLYKILRRIIFITYNADDCVIVTAANSLSDIKRQTKQLRIA